MRWGPRTSDAPGLSEGDDHGAPGIRRGTFQPEATALLRELAEDCAGSVEAI